jgi:hypothetical protein
MGVIDCPFKRLGLFRWLDLPGLFTESAKEQRRSGCFFASRHLPIAFLSVARMSSDDRKNRVPD